MTEQAAKAPTSWLDRLPRGTLLAGLILLLVLAAFLWLTPAGLIGKADAVGYAVCHRITVRSFLFPDGRQLPMCARCSGTFVGVLIGLLGPALIFGRRRSAGFPPLPALGLMLAFSAWWAFDGANSFTWLLPDDLGIPRLFAPSNFLRVTTGMFHGVTMGGLVLPVVNAVLWKDANRSPIIENLWQLLGLYAFGITLIVAFLSGYPVFLYPLAILSGIGAISILSSAMLVLVVSFRHTENRALSVFDALPDLFLALTFALLMIGGIDAMRYAAFGSWGGFEF